MNLFRKSKFKNKILGCYFSTKTPFAWAWGLWRGKQEERNYTPPGDRVTFNGWKAGIDGPMNRETSHTCESLSLYASMRKLVFRVCVHVRTFYGVWFHFLYLFSFIFYSHTTWQVAIQLQVHQYWSPLNFGSGLSFIVDILSIINTCFFLFFFCERAETYLWHLTWNFLES